MAARVPVHFVQITGNTTTGAGGHEGPLPSQPPPTPLRTLVRYYAFCYNSGAIK